MSSYTPELSKLAAWLREREGLPPRQFHGGDKTTNDRQQQVRRKRKAYERLARWIQAHRKTYRKLNKRRMQKWRRSKR